MLCVCMYIYIYIHMQDHARRSAGLVGPDAAAQQLFLEADKTWNKRADAMSSYALTFVVPISIWWWLLLLFTEYHIIWQNITINYCLIMYCIISLFDYNCLSTPARARSSSRLTKHNNNNNNNNDNNNNNNRIATWCHMRRFAREVFKQHVSLSWVLLLSFLQNITIKRKRKIRKKKTKNENWPYLLKTTKTKNAGTNNKIADKT